MKEISVHDLEPGMVVGKDVITSASHFLISRGTTINDFLKKSLIKYNISTIIIEENHERELSEEIREGIEYQAWEAVMKRFRSVPEETMMNKIFETAIKIEMSEYFDG